MPNDDDLPDPTVAIQELAQQMKSQKEQRITHVLGCPGPFDLTPSAQVAPPDSAILKASE